MLCLCLLPSLALQRFLPHSTPTTHARWTPSLLTNFPRSRTRAIRDRGKGVCERLYVASGFQARARFFDDRTLRYDRARVGHHREYVAVFGSLSVSRALMPLSMSAIAAWGLVSRSSGLNRVVRSPWRSLIKQAHRPGSVFGGILGTRSGRVKIPRCYASISFRALSHGWVLQNGRRGPGFGISGFLADFRFGWCAAGVWEG